MSACELLKVSIICIAHAFLCHLYLYLQQHSAIYRISCIDVYKCFSIWRMFACVCMMRLHQKTEKQFMCKNSIYIYFLPCQVICEWSVWQLAGSSTQCLNQFLPQHLLQLNAIKTTNFLKAKNVQQITTNTNYYIDKTEGIDSFYIVETNLTGHKNSGLHFEVRKRTIKSYRRIENTAKSLFLQFQQIEKIRLLK